MNFIKKICFIMVLIGLFFTLGCAAKKITTITKPIKTKLSNYNVLKIEQFYYDSKVEIKDADHQIKANKLRDMLQERTKYDIYALSLFEKVLDKEPISENDRVVLLKGRITFMKRVTKAARIMLGAMAGRSRVDVDIQLVDNKTGEILGGAEIKGTSTGGTIFAGGTEEAFVNTSKQIADFIKTNY